MEKLNENETAVLTFTITVVYRNNTHKLHLIKLGFCFQTQVFLAGCASDCAEGFRFTILQILDSPG